MNFFIRSCRWAGKWLGKRWKEDTELEESLRFLRWEIGMGEVKAFALLSSLLSLLPLFLLLLLSPKFLPLLLLPPLVYWWVRTHPIRQMEKERERGRGEVPRLLCALSSSLLLNPNLEVAVSFAAENAEGKMGPELKRELSNFFLGIHKGAEEVLRRFSERWGNPPELSKPLPLLLASVKMGEEDRRKALEQALETSLEEVRERLRSFLGWVKLPLFLLYSFGVVLPLCLLTLVPVLGSTGLLSSPLPLVMLYGFLLPSTLYLLSSWILSKRPLFSSPHDSPSAGIFFFLLPLPLLFPLFRSLPPSEPGVLGFLWLVVLLLSLYFLSKRDGGEHLRSLEMEEDFPGFLQELGSRLREGRPMEEALRRASENRGKLWERWEDSPSRLVKGTLFLLLGLAERSERATGEAALQLSSHLRKLREVERWGRQELAEISSSMRSMALFFSPLIISLTCQMYSVLWKRGMGFLPSFLPPPLLLFLLGSYQLILTLFLLHLLSEMEGTERGTLFASGLPLSLSMFTLGTIGGGAFLSFLT